MPLASFHDLCESLCDLIGIAPPHLGPDEHGTVSFTVSCDGVDIGFIQDDSTGEPGAVMVTVFGAVDEVRELRALRALLDLNFLASGIGAPVFVRNPVTQDIALHQAFALPRSDVQEVYRRMLKTKGAAVGWKTGEFFNRTEVSA